MVSDTITAKDPNPDTKSKAGLYSFTQKKVIKVNIKYLEDQKIVYTRPSF